MVFVQQRTELKGNGTAECYIDMAYFSHNYLCVTFSIPNGFVTQSAFFSHDTPNTKEVN